MTCPNCHSDQTTKVSKKMAIFGLAAFGIMGIITIIAPVIALIFIGKTIKGPEYYKCKNCKKRFSETEAKAVTA